MKENRRSKGIIIFAVFIVLLSVLIIWFITLPRNSISVSYDSNKNTCAEINGALYYIRYDGVYRVDLDNEAENILPVDTEKCHVLFSLSDKLIYVAEPRNNKIAVTSYDLNGNVADEPKLLPYSDTNFTILKIENGSVVALKSTNDDHELIKLDMNNLSEPNSLNLLRYEDDDIYFIGDNDNTYLARTSSLCDYIGRNGEKLFYSSEYYKSEINMTDIETQSKKACSISSSYSDYFIAAQLTDSVIVAITTNISGYFFEKINVYGDTSSLKYHNFDTCYIIDADSLTILDSHKFHKHERIIYADNVKVLTYYKGKYRTYSVNDWKLISSKKSNMNENGSYSFQSCGDYIFIFDESSGKMVNKIPLSSIK